MADLEQQQQQQQQQEEEDEDIEAQPKINNQDSNLTNGTKMEEEADKQPETMDVDEDEEEEDDDDEDEDAVLVEEEETKEQSEAATQDLTLKESKASNGIETSLEDDDEDDDEVEEIDDEEEDENNEDNEDDEEQLHSLSSEQKDKENGADNAVIEELDDDDDDIEDDDEVEDLDKDKVLEIDDDDELSSSSSVPSKTVSTNSNEETIELNDDDDGDVVIVEPKENGTNLNTSKPAILKKPKVIILDKSNKNTKNRKVVGSPRRSARTLTKNRSFAEQSSEESDIEEVLPQDPLKLINDSISIERILGDKSSKKSSTIVVKDTKKLVEIASKSSNSTPGKKEPTLVIIDTNSILSGRGAVPLTKTGTSVLPMALPAQGMYNSSMRATITPIPVKQPQTQPSQPLLPTLTDDMFVVEAPSFIVPYVYEKPPIKDLKQFVGEFKKKVQDMIRQEAEEKKKNSKDGDEEEDDDEDLEEDDVQLEEPSKKKRRKNDDEEYRIEDEKDVDSEEEGKSRSKSDKPYTYFDSPLGKFFVDIGFNLVQEYVQSDLLKQQKRKRDRENGQNKETERTIQSLIKNLEYSKENNEPFKMTLKKCEFCSFKTESKLALAHHLETPHMKNFVYRCNYCAYEVRSPHDILFHMEAEHAIRGHLERAPAFHQCSSCPFEDNQKGKLSRHLVACQKKFKPERNMEPPVDWEPPAKIPRMPKMRQQGLNATAAAYQALAKTSQYQLLSKMQLSAAQQQQQQFAVNRGRGRPPTVTSLKQQHLVQHSATGGGLMFGKQALTASGGGSVLVPTNFQLSGNQVFKSQGGTKKPVHQPSISITPLPRTSTTSSSSSSSGLSSGVTAKPGDSNSKNSFVICEICDGYIKDLEQLRNHMQWIHKIKIHPKMIYNRPPLNCQKCQFRFFTDQGLERHLLGSHGLVTSSMQDAANKSKDSGRCPVCGRVYQWKLLNHVARDHNMTLKPAHLSYKCTVCTATFGMYKQFENHVYSAHSVVAKRVMDKKAATALSAKEALKPLKINDEITIIPQPAKSSNGADGVAGAGSSKAR